MSDRPALPTPAPPLVNASEIEARVSDLERRVDDVARRLEERAQKAREGLDVPAVESEGEAARGGPAATNGPRSD